jgi:transposase
MRGPHLAPLELTASEQEVLRALARRRKAEQAMALRARIILRCAAGESNSDVALALGCSREMVGKWRSRFVRDGVEGLTDGRRSGRPRMVTDGQVSEVVAKTLEELPAGATHWSTRSMAQATGLSQSTVSRIWRAFALAPHRADQFKLSRDPEFVSKVRDVVGLYLDPPERALVLCCDEKTQIQALDRTQPILPMMAGTPQRFSHDYLRHGTTSLFAALDVGSGKVFGSLYRKHRSEEFRKFLTLLDRQVPADLEVHLILDNYATHKTAAVHRWLVRHPRFHLHFTPTSASWLNLVERWFAELTNKKLRRSTYSSVPDLEADIRQWMEHWNDEPRPYIWTKTADEILETLANYCRRISDSQH